MTMMNSIEDRALKERVSEAIQAMLESRGNEPDYGTYEEESDPSFKEDENGLADTESQQGLMENYRRDLKSFPIMKHEEQVRLKRSIMTAEYKLCQAICSTPMGLRLLAHFYKRLWNKEARAGSRSHNWSSIILSGPQQKAYEIGEDNPSRIPVDRAKLNIKCRKISEECSTLADEIEKHYKAVDAGRTPREIDVEALRALRDELAKEVLDFRPKIEHWLALKAQYNESFKKLPENVGKKSRKSNLKYHAAFNEAFDNTIYLIDRFVEGNLRLVHKAANSMNLVNASLSDVIQAGNMMMRRAVEKWDPDKASKFSTYSTLWIDQGMRKEIRKTLSTTHRTGTMNNLICKVTKGIASHLQETNYTPTTLELAQKLALPEPKVIDALLALKPETRLDHAKYEDGETDYYDTLQTTQPDMASSVIARVTLAKMLTRLTKRERDVICRRTGITCPVTGKTYTAMKLDDVGKFYNVSRERTRQIEKGAIRRMNNFIAYDRKQLWGNDSMAIPSIDKLHL